MSDVCSFKKDCKKCTWVKIGDRPTMCKSLSCPEYTPCRTCKNNKTLDAKGLCKECDGKTQAVVVRDPDGTKRIIDSPVATHPALANTSPVQGTISFPGTAPAHYGPDESQYYKMNWESYSGYYRDPTAYAIIHNIILVEVELMHCISQMAQDRAVSNKDLEQKHERLVKNMNMLRSTLPERESLELNEDEKALGAIYERYLEETKDTRVSGVKKLISPDAVALAPTLKFPVNITDVLVKLGYRIVDINEALNMYFRPDEIPEKPENLLEFMGFFLKEKYAMPEGATFQRAELDDLDEGEMEDVSGVVDNILRQQRESEERKKEAEPKPEEDHKPDGPGIAFSGDF